MAPYLHIWRCHVGVPCKRKILMLTDFCLLQKQEVCWMMMVQRLNDTIEIPVQCLLVDIPAEHGKRLARLFGRLLQRKRGYGGREHDRENRS